MTDRDILLEILKQNQTSTKSESVLSGKNINSLIIAAIIGAVAWLFAGVTEQPLKNSESFAAIATQNAEIRTTVLELKQSVNNLNSKIDSVTKDNSDVKSRTERNAGDIETLKQRVSKLEGHD